MNEGTFGRLQEYEGIWIVRRSGCRSGRGQESLRAQGDAGPCGMCGEDVAGDGFARLVPLPLGLGEDLLRREVQVDLDRRHVVVPEDELPLVTATPA